MILLAAGAAPARADQPPVTTIREAFADANGDQVPDRPGQPTTITGVITYEPRVINQRVHLADLQDATGGILLFSEQPTHLAGRRRGDLVEVLGSVHHALPPHAHADGWGVNGSLLSAGYGLRSAVCGA